MNVKPHIPGAEAARNSQTEQHTPGPWTVTPFNTPDREDDPMGVYKVEPVATKLQSGYDNAPFCQDDTSELDGVHAENHANARLIAAAPELLAMCQNALEALEGLSESNACLSDFERACIPSLKAAIAKAVGAK